MPYKVVLTAIFCPSRHQYGYYACRGIESSRHIISGRSDVGCNCCLDNRKAVLHRGRQCCRETVYRCPTPFLVGQVNVGDIASCLTLMVTCLYMERSRIPGDRSIMPYKVVLTVFLRPRRQLQGAYTFLCVKGNCNGIPIG